MTYEDLPKEAQKIIAKKREQMLDDIQQKIYEYLYVESAQAENEDAEDEAYQLRMMLSISLKTAEVFLRSKRILKKMGYKNNL